MHEVSIILPVYNVSKYLREGLDSIVNQTFKDFEVICIDDGSTDNGFEILSEYAKSDERFKIIRQENNGLPVARNVGLQNATGKYVYFMGPDDTIHPQLLEICLLYAKKYNAEFVSFGWKTSKSRVLTSKPINTEDIPHEVTENPLFQGCKRHKYYISFNVWSKLYKRDLLEGISFMPELRNFQDYPFVYEVLSKRPKTVCLDVALYFYYSRPGNITHSPERPERIIYYRKGVERVCEIYSRDGFEKELEFIKHDFIPTILKMQLGKIHHADWKNKIEMYKLFTEELCDLKKKGFLHLKGHKFQHCLKYAGLFICDFMKKKVFKSK